MKKLHYGMVGGGKGAFIGNIHRQAIALDNLARLTAGSFSHDFSNTLEIGMDLEIPSDRLYPTYLEMAQKEAARKDRIDFVSIVTPNYLHYPIAKAFLNAGINVVCDKPLALRESEARELDELTIKNGLLFAVTYAYTGYPLVKQAREMVKRGDLGDIRFINAEYPQDWLLKQFESDGHKLKSWRANPSVAGISNCVGDIGTHIEYLVSYITGLKIKSLCARLDTFMEGHELDDNATILLEFEGGAKGVYWTSQTAIGYDNGLKIRIFGSKGSLRWSQEDPNYLVVSKLNSPTEIISRGRDDLYPKAQDYSRIPAGHPEGYIEAFANIYRAFTNALLKKSLGDIVTEEELDFPNARDGANGVRFVEKCVESSKKGAIWVEF
ncbi:MAG TPA: Gfo/Idh/MocA family oxidoreductase [Rectinema sp.]|jgi:predicted dehydrogenase|nr:Gfo/Idh/MocA family oxidoreductase [Rectinema sp.]HNT59898.1 Gfo/Idh/MocA family oxidoreductase [Rectinema sp.]HNV36419.1 Gfo/Idh/MocA family oxidoreductase [Rectinema sp.]HNZ93799.1 Gfo/Idh/MocA family oxidoreductase [Rectinema sp.]HOH17258.1 Gfo/Idh/MocA family oxidoreductase [Rectinema sp.]